MALLEANLHPRRTADDDGRDREECDTSAATCRDKNLAPSPRFVVEDCSGRPEVAQRFMRDFVGEYLHPAFGARTKSETDLLILDCLIKAGALNPAAPLYDLSRSLNLTTAKTRSLLLNWQLRSKDLKLDLHASLVEALLKTRFSKDGSVVIFGIENPLLKEDLEARLRTLGIFVEGSLTRDIVRLSASDFAELLDQIVDQNVKARLRQHLKDGQSPSDDSFKAVITRVLRTLGERSAEKVGDALVKEALEHIGLSEICSAGSKIEGLLRLLLHHI